MFELKLEYLADENLSLKRQLRDLKHIISLESPQNQKSLVFQLRESNEQLSAQMQRVKDELLLQRSARQIQRTEHSEIVQQLNRCIFELKEEVAMLENILRKDPSNPSESTPLGKLFRRERQKERSQSFHKYANPVLFFQILESLLAYIESSQKFVDSEDELYDTQNPVLPPNDPFESSQHRLVSRNISIEEIVRNIEENVGNQHSTDKWLGERSSLYFLRKHRREDLHLSLAKAKALQQQYVKAEEKEDKGQAPITTNVELLKRSYVQLVGQYQILKSKYRNLGRYVSEVQHRNQLLIDSRKGRLA